MEQDLEWCSSVVGFSAVINYQMTRRAFLNNNPVIVAPTMSQRSEQPREGTMFYNRFTSRREMMKSTMALFAAGLLGKGVPTVEAQSSIQNVNKHSSPSTLKITDLRYTVVKKPGQAHSHHSH